MFLNPFSPIFGGKPGVFFGRKEILSRFELAMIDQGSDDRALFFTGTRGSGKTALLEQLSIRASARKRTVIDLGPEDTIQQLVSALSGYDETTDTINPQASINILGVGGGFSAKSVSRTKHIGREHLQSLLLEACEKKKHGILVTVDEIQKVPVEDLSSLCNAFQMASRKGYDIMLAVAGLPYSYNTITHHEGCTYLRRSAHETLGLFSWEEAEAAFREAFSGIQGCAVSDTLIHRLNQASFGHPYLMQLMGYYLILEINENNSEKTHTATEAEIETSITNALISYERRALKPLLEELPNSEQKYLEIMSECLNDDRTARTADIAARFGVPQKQLSNARAHLIANGVIASPERGTVMFCIPYLADYIKKSPTLDSSIQIARKRRV